MPLDGAWRKNLTKHYHEFQSQCHPDISPQDSDVSAYLNLAFECLKDPVSRCKYLLTLQGVNTNPETGGTQVTMPPAFLQEILELNETIEECDSNLERLKKGAEEKFGAKLLQVQEAFEAGDLEVMKVRVAELSYLASALRRIGNVELDRSLRD